MGYPEGTYYESLTNRQKDRVNHLKRFGHAYNQANFLHLLLFDEKFDDLTTDEKVDVWKQLPPDLQHPCPKSIVRFFQK